MRSTKALDIAEPWPHYATGNRGVAGRMPALQSESWRPLTPLETAALQSGMPALQSFPPCYDDASMVVIQTERLVLRHFTPDDAAFIFELLNEPGWIRYIGDRGINDLDAAHNYIETAAIASYKRHGFGLYAVELKADGGLVGMCGLIKRETLDDVDIGFALLSRFEGNGFASEAVNATLAYAREDLGLERVVAITTEDNYRSCQVLDRAGMTYQQIILLPNDDEPLRFYAIDFSSPVDNTAR